ncbi:MAG: hypothetical protein KJ967_02730 [Elusimicrobia bacterium]|nr:hypothetical protein [Elusimicrobiota bacterium]
MINTGWSDRKKLLILIVLLLFAFAYGSLSTELKIYKARKENPTKTKVDTVVVKTSPQPTLKPTPMASVLPKPTFTPIASSIPTSQITFNNNVGNNYVAAKYAQDIMNTANKAVPNFILDSYLELSPEDIKDQDEETYKKKVSSAFLTVSVNNLFWNQMNDNSKKDVVGSFVVSVGNIFPGGYPHITVSNGIRTVATGEYNWLKTEPKVTLK